MVDKNSQAFKNLKKTIETEIAKCIRCGECRLICPVYNEKHAERYTSRAKLLIVNGLVQGTLDFTPEVREAMENCLLCTGCASQCSSNVQSDKVIIAARHVFAEELGIPFYKQLITKTMRSKKLMDTGVKLGSMGVDLLFKKVPETSGLYRRFAMPKIDEKQYIPEIAHPTFRDEVQMASVGGNKKVIFFTGCMANYFMPEVSKSLVKVLNKLNVDVEVPNEQGCCGMPMLASGDKESVKIAALVNISALAKLSPPSSDVAIVVACASCGHMLQHGYKEMLKDETQIHHLLDNIAERTIDINQYLINTFGEEKIASMIKPETSIKATYHDPCHLRKAQKIVKEPRALLDIASGGNFAEMQKPEACCGLGGTYTLAQMELSKSIQKKKIDDALQTEANCIVTSCPGCVLQLRDGVRRSAKIGAEKTKVKHIIQVLADSIID